MPIKTTLSVPLSKQSGLWFHQSTVSFCYFVPFYSHQNYIA